MDDEKGGQSPIVSVRNLTKTYEGASQPAVLDVSFDVQKGESLCLLGPSGCGKTTTLRSIAGLESISAGEIFIRGTLSSSPDRIIPPNKRNLGMVFQSYALWPHMTVIDNVAYPLRRQGKGRRESREAAEEHINKVGLEGLGERYPSNVSGGQQQRVALARALAGGADVLLFDEPLSNLDARRRASMRHELRRLHQELNISSVYVTHDQAEAMVLGDEIVVMKDGSVEQRGDPMSVYLEPRSLFSGNFL